MTGLVDPGFLYCVRVEIDPIAGAAYRDWLFGGHIDAVVSFPGIHWARAIDAKDQNEDGWDRFMVVYGMESEATFIAYQNSELFASFKPVWEEHKDVFRISRDSGPVVAKA